MWTRLSDGGAPPTEKCIPWGIPWVILHQPICPPGSESLEEAPIIFSEVPKGLSPAGAGGRRASHHGMSNWLSHVALD